MSENLLLRLLFLKMKSLVCYFLVVSINYFEFSKSKKLTSTSTERTIIKNNSGAIEKLFVLGDVMELYKSDLDIMYIYIIAGCSGGVVITIVVIIIVCCCCCKKKEQEESNEMELKKTKSIIDLEQGVTKNDEIEVVKQSNKDKSDLDNTDLPLAKVGVVNIEDRFQKYKNDEEEAHKELKKLLETNKVKGITKMSLRELVKKNGEKNNDSSTYSLTENSIDAAYNKIKKNMDLELDGLNSEVRSNPDENILKDPNASEEVLDEEPKMKNIRFVMDDNDVLELEISDEEAEVVEKANNIYGEKRESEIGVGVGNGKFFDIPIHHDPMEVDPVDANSKIAKKQKLETEAINEFKTMVSKQKKGQKTPIKDQLKQSRETSTYKVQLTTEQNHIPYHKGKKIVEKVFKSNTNLLDLNAETPDEKVDDGEYNSRDRSEPNNSFFENSFKEEVIEEEPKMDTVEIEEDEQEDLENEVTTKKR